MNKLISNAISSGISREDVEYIFHLDNKTKQKALSSINSEQYILFGHWETRRENSISAIDKRLSEVIIHNTNYKTYGLLSQILFKMNQRSMSEKGFKKLIFQILSLPVLLLSSPAVRLNEIKKLLR